MNTDLSTLRSLFGSIWSRNDASQNKLPWTNDKIPRRTPSSGNELEVIKSDETDNEIKTSSPDKYKSPNLGLGFVIQKGILIGGATAPKETLKEKRVSKSWPPGEPAKVEKLLRRSISDDEGIENYINQMHLQARLEKGSPTQSAILNLIYNAACPKGANLHVHSEGLPKSLQLHQLILENGKDLFWDLDKQKCKWKLNSKKIDPSKVRRIPWEQLQEDYIKQICCVPGTSFDETFGPRGEFLDYIPFKKFLEMVFTDMETNNIIYQELMFGVYLPVPSKMRDFIQQFHNKMTAGNIQKCITYLNDNDKKLKNILTPLELAKLQSFIRKRIKDNPKGYCEKLINLTYPEAFHTYLTTFLKDLDPKYFDVKEELTIKLIFEIMRHRSLGEFFVTLYSILEFIQEDNSIIRGFTIDGPQKDKNSIENFTDHMDIIAFLRPRYSKVKVTLHALEYNKDDSKNIIHATNEIERIPSLVDRIGHGIILPTNNHLLDSLIDLQKNNISLEICLTTGSLTAGVEIKDFSVKTYKRAGITFAFGTDDPGIVDTTMAEEIKKAIIHLGFSFEDIVRSFRTSFYSSFLEGPSIYDVLRTKKIDEEGKAFIQVDFVIKNPFSEFNWENPAEVLGKMNDLTLSEKQYKECQFEIKLHAFKEKIRSNLPKYVDAGILPGKLDRSQSDSQITKK